MDEKKNDVEKSEAAGEHASDPGQASAIGSAEDGGQVKGQSDGDGEKVKDEADKVEEKVEDDANKMEGKVEDETDKVEKKVGGQSDGEKVKGDDEKVEVKVEDGAVTVGDQVNNEANRVEEQVKGDVDVVEETVKDETDVGGVVSTQGDDHPQEEKSSVGGGHVEECSAAEDKRDEAPAQEAAAHGVIQVDQEAEEGTRTGEVIEIQDGAQATGDVQSDAQKDSKTETESPPGNTEADSTPAAADAPPATPATTTAVADTTAATVATGTKPPVSTKTIEERRESIKISNFLRQFRGSGGFRKFTASQFMTVWNHYDSDGNGYIAEGELDDFLKEFVLSTVNEKEVKAEILSEAAMAHFKETFMDAFDENQDGMIDIAELAEILPTDENFLLLFHLKNPLDSSVHFMKIWREFDKNCDGYIESTELKPFLKHILDNQKTSVSDEKLDEYTETILNLFDLNRDGRLQLSEMARLMPVKQNFLSKPILKGASCITRSDIDRLFKIYDQNRNGTIEDEELSGLLKDLMDLSKKEYTLNDIENMKKIIMDHWDTDHDGTISKSELRMFLIQQCRISKESQGIQYDDGPDDEDDDDDYD